MADAIVVLNAGSSSIKYSVFRLEDDSPALALRGQIEGIYTAARFVARNPDGATILTRNWDGEGPLGHDGAIRFLLDYLHGELAGHRLLAVGHRVVHGGTDYDHPVPDVQGQSVADCLATW